MFKNIFFGLFIFLFVFIGVANAHGTSNNVVQKSVEQKTTGLLPGDFFYFLDVFSEKIGTLFTFGDIPNVKRHVYLADKRLNEARELSSLGRDKDAGMAVKKYQTQISNALNRAKKAKVDGKNTDAVLSNIAETTVTSQTILANIYDKVASSEKSTVKDAMKNSMNGYESALGEISKKKQVEIKPKIDKLLGDINKELTGLKNEGKNFPEVKMKYMNNQGEFSDMETTGSGINNDNKKEKEINNEVKSSELESKKKEDTHNSEKEKKNNEGDSMGMDNMLNNVENSNSENSKKENSDSSKINREMDGGGNNRMGDIHDN